MYVPRWILDSHHLARLALDSHPHLLVRIRFDSLSPYLVLVVLDLDSHCFGPYSTCTTTLCGSFLLVVLDLDSRFVASYWAQLARLHCVVLSYWVGFVLALVSPHWAGFTPYTPWSLLGCTHNDIRLLLVGYDSRSRSLNLSKFYHIPCTSSPYSQNTLLSIYIL